MRLRVYSPALYGLLLLGVALWGTAAAPAAAQTPALEAANAVQAVLSEGQRLEGERRWGDALTLYEEALRANPGQAPLEERLQIARLHYDLGRRYHDKSFHRSLALGEREALGLYLEVLLKIQSHHVDQPDWKRLVDRGTLALTAALDDQEFVARHLPHASAEEIAQFRLDVAAQVGAFLIRTRHEARDAVAWAARFGQERVGLSPTATVFEYLCGASNLLDDYSSYLTGDQLHEVYSQIEGNFVGLGIELKAHEGALQILRVIPGSPAERGGIRPLDQIVAVDGQSTHSLSTDQAANLLQGKEGSLVEVTVVTPGQAPRNLSLRRAYVEVPSVDDVKMIDPTYGIAYLRLTCFQKTTPRDLDAALWKLHRQGMRSLVIDLRGNPGGLLSASVEVVDKFVSQGSIVSTRGRSKEEDFNYSAHAAGTWRVPLVVLIDGDSASASEIFAGAIRDHGRGKIIGTTSFGKGSVQGIFPLSGTNAGIRLTTAKFYSPKGHPFNKVGVAPDIKVQQSARPIDGELEIPQPGDPNDPVVVAALRAARDQLARR